MIHIGSRSPCTPFSSSLHDTIFLSHANPHRVFWHCFSRLSETLRKTLGNPRKPSQLQWKPGGNPSKCLHTPFAPLQGFLSPCIARFVLGADASTSAPVLDGGNTQPLSTLSGQDSLTRALKTSCHLELKIRWLPSPLLTSRHLWDSNPRGKTPCLSRSANVSSAKSASQLHSSPGSHVTVSLCFLCPLHLAISPALTDS